MSKHLIIAVIVTLLVSVGATAINAQLAVDDAAAIVAGLRSTSAMGWIDGGFAQVRAGGMSKDDILDLLIEVPPDTIQ